MKSTDIPQCFLIVLCLLGACKSAQTTGFDMGIQKGHTARIDKLVLSPDGSLIATGSTADSIVKIWTGDCRLIRTVKVDARLKHITFSPNGEKFVCVSAGYTHFTVSAWNLRGELLGTIREEVDRTFELSGEVAFGAGDRIAVATEREIKIFSLQGKLLKTVHYGKMNFVRVYALEGGTVLAGELYTSDLAATAFWNFEGKFLRKLVTRNPLIPFGKHLAAYIIPARPCYVCDKKGRKKSLPPQIPYIEVYDPITGARINRIKLPAEIAGIDLPQRACFSPDGRFFAVRIPSGTIALYGYDGHGLGLIKSLEARGSVSDLSFSAHSGFLALVIHEGGISRLETRDIQSGGVISYSPPPFGNRPRCLSLSGNGRVIAQVGQRDLDIWSLSRGKHLFAVPLEDSDGYDRTALNTEGSILACTSRKGIRLYNARGEPVKILTYPPLWKKGFYPSGGLFFSADGKGLILHGSGRRGDLLVFWDLAGKSRHLLLEGRVYLNAGGNRITVVRGDEVSVADISGRVVKKFRITGDRKALAVSGDGRRIATASADPVVRVWDDTGRLLHTIEGPRYEGAKRMRVRDLVFSPNGKFITLRLTLYRNDGGVLAYKSTLWDAEEGVFIRKLEHLENIFSPDSGSIVSYNGRNLHYLTSYGRPVGAPRILDALLEKVSFTPDGKYLAALCDDMTLRVINVSTGKTLAFLSDGREWIMYTPSGYFDGSRYGGSLLAMTESKNAVGVDQFALRNNRPDLILRELSVDAPEEIDRLYHQHLRRLKKWGLSEESAVRTVRAPLVRIMEMKQDFRDRGGKFVDLRLSLRARGGSLRSYNIYVNDVALFGSGGRKISGKEMDIPGQRVELTAGRNKIEVTCVSDRGVESLRALTYAYYKKEAKGNLYFLGFGVSRYRDSALNLKYAGKDVMDMAELFSRMEERYNRIIVKTYVDSEVTREKIRKAKSLFDGAGVDDTVVLFIAGHGLHDNDSARTYYYLTSDADIKRLSATAADFDMIEDLLQGISPRKKLFLMDTCESGEVEDEKSGIIASAEGLRGVRPRTSRALSIKVREMRGVRMRAVTEDRDRFIYNDLQRRSGAVVLSSSRGGEFSYESDSYANGLFTEEIINALKGRADRSRDRFVSLRELKEYVIKTVPKISGNRQHPTVDRDNLSADWKFPVVK